MGYLEAGPELVSGRVDPWCGQLGRSGDKAAGIAVVLSVGQRFVDSSGQGSSRLKTVVLKRQVQGDCTSRGGEDRLTYKPEVIEGKGKTVGGHW